MTFYLTFRVIRQRYLFPTSIGLIMAVLSFASTLHGDEASQVIALNQVGYLSAQPKRFTAPLTPDGTPFVVREKNAADPLFEGRITNNIGDFSAFTPSNSATHYVIEMRSDGSTEPTISDPFLVSDNLWLDQFWKPATDFMIDCRAVTGTHASSYGGGAWRDSAYYSFEGPSLLLMLKANPERTVALARQINWAADKARVLDQNFVFDDGCPGSEGVLEATRRYYTELEPPATDAPDLVKLLHWGYGFLLMKPESKDPSGDPLPLQIHSQHVEQFAWLLDSWPQLAPWLPESFRKRCHDFAFAHWESSGLFKVDPNWDPAKYDDPLPPEKPLEAAYLHPYKGRHAPGNSIAPNLKMYGLALREGRSEAPRFLTAAQTQTQWLVDNIDWNDPRATKGHRMSEFRTITGLVWFLQNYPDEAPPALRGKITEWARFAVARSSNLWDFRRYDLENHWSIPRINEPGNLLGFTAAALAASWVIQEPELRSRLREIAFAQYDAFFGRNPVGAVGVSYPKDSFPEIERPWPIGFKFDQCARLETTRGSISSSAGTKFYPYQPNASFRYSEGWVNFNTAWNVALAYVHFDLSGKFP